MYIYICTYIYICISIYLYFYLIYIYIHLPHDIPQCLLVTCSLLHLHWFMLPWHVFIVESSEATTTQPPVVWGTLFRQTFKVLEILGIILVHDLVIQKNIRKCVDILTLLIQRLVDDGTASQNSTLARIQMIINGNKHNKGSLAIYWDQLKMC